MSESVPTVPGISPAVKPKRQHVSYAKGRRLMRQMVRLLESKYGNPPRAKIYTASTGGIS